MRTAIYARFSTDMQSAASADDQIRECKAYAERQGWTVVLVECDEAVRAGAFGQREGYASLLKAAEPRTLDVLLEITKLGKRGELNNERLP